jgi:serine phosphatase RsbU (regulator of sigma subunit)
MVKKDALPEKRGRKAPVMDRQVKVQKALYEIADAASAVTDMQSFYRKLHKIVGKLMYARNFFIALYDEQSDLITWPYYVDTVDVESPPPTRLADHHGATGWILRQGKTLADVDGSVAQAIQRGESEPIGSVSDGIGIPLKNDGKTLGVLLVQSYKANIKFSLQDIEILNFVAQHISTALARVRAMDETRQRNAELEIINSVQEGLASKLDVQAIYELVGDRIRKTFNAQVVSIDTYDHDTAALHGRYYFEAGRVLAGGTYPSFGFRKHVIEKRQPIIINTDMLRWMKEYDNPVIQGLQPKSAIFIPMIVGGEAIGVISLQNNDQENAFSEADIRLLTTLANSMSIALENARLWEQEKLYRKALERELEIGREIQRGFLPEVLPQVDGWEIAATLLAAREVAGDFYDAFELPDGNIGLVIADVCDKGVGAALFMTLFRSLIRAAATLDYFEDSVTVNAVISTTDRLQRAMLLTNNYIAETHGDSGMFATVFFGILDPRAGRLTYINGGHEPPLILRSGAVAEVLHKTGPAVGVVIDHKYTQLETHLHHGDTLFAFTDGVLDSQNPAGQQYGRNRLKAVSQKFCGSAHELVQFIEAELRNYGAGATQFDDITLLAVRCC